MTLPRVTPAVLLGAAVAMLMPSLSNAATIYHYTCSDFADQFLVTCTGSTITMTAAGGNIKDDTPTVHNLSGSPSTWYVSFTYTGSGAGRMKIAGDVNDGAFVNFSASAVAVPVTSGVSNTNQFIALYDNSAFTGTIADVCLTDTSGMCENPGPLPVGGATSTLEQAEQNLAQAFWLYLLCFFGVVWLLRKH